MPAESIQLNAESLRKPRAPITTTRAQGEKEFGVKTLEEAGPEAELTETVADLGKKYDDQVARLKADFTEAVGEV